MTIKTTHTCPPVPSRRFDWTAIDSDSYDGAPDSPNRHQIGYGATEQEAIDDLKAQLEAPNDKLRHGSRNSPRNLSKRRATHSPNDKADRPEATI